MYDMATEVRPSGRRGDVLVYTIRDRGTLVAVTVDKNGYARCENCRSIMANTCPHTRIVREAVAQENHVIPLTMGLLRSA